jgi:hypothetical protein
MDRQSGRDLGVSEDVQPPEDYLKQYLEGRTDVREYAKLIAQVITLLLTSIVIVMGWLAKDYLNSTYQTAANIHFYGHYAVVAAGSDDRALGLEGASSAVGANAGIGTAKGNMGAARKDMEAIQAIYNQLLSGSRMTVLILAGLSIFMEIALATMLVLAYLLQRRRYFNHKFAIDHGLDNEQPVIDPVLTRRSLNVFMILIGCVAVGLLGVTLWQGVRLLFHWSVVNTLIFLSVFSFIGVKAWSTATLGANYVAYEKREGWKARYRYAPLLLLKIRELATKEGCLVPMDATLKELEKICGNSRFKSEKAGRKLVDLLKGLKGVEISYAMSDTLEELVKTLRHDRLLRQFKFCDPENMRDGTPLSEDNSMHEAELSRVDQLCARMCDIK